MELGLNCTRMKRIRYAKARINTDFFKLYLNDKLRGNTDEVLKYYCRATNGDPSFLGMTRLREFLMKTIALALIEAVSFYGGVHHKRYKWIAGNSS